MKFFDGMDAVVEESGNKSLCLATRRGLAIDRLTIGFWPRPQYEQIGVYYGETKEIGEGSIVKVWFRKDNPFKWYDIKKRFKWSREHPGNIERIELVSRSEPLTMKQSFRDFFRLTP